MQTPKQQFYLAKLLGFTYTISYKPSRENAAANVLSRHLAHSICHSMSFSTSTPNLFIPDDYDCDPYYRPLFDQLHLQPNSILDYTIRDGVHLYRGKFLLSPSSALRVPIITELHSTLHDGHDGIQRTLAHVQSLFFWPTICKENTIFVQQCIPCQTTKYSTQHPLSLLQPRPLPSNIWDEISTVFITALPSSSRSAALLVIVDRLSKYGHFIYLPAAFTTSKVATVFAKEYCRLHGFPKAIVSDRDPLFMSQFWKDLHRLSGTILKHSTAYHLLTQE